MYVTDNCGVPVTAGTVVATFTNSDTPVALAPLGDGRWTGTWIPRRPGGGRVSIVVKAQLPNSPAQGAQTRTGTLP